MHRSGIVAVVLLAAGCGRGSFAPVTDATALDADRADPLAAFLVAEWRFDEGAGSTTGDSAGHGHDGTLMGPIWTTGHRGGALSFNSTYVDVPASPAFDRPVAASFTMSSWFRREAPESHGMAIWVSTGASMSGFGLEIESDTLINYFDGSSHVAESTASMAIGEWHHLAMVVSSVNATIYFDGVPLVTAAPTDITARASTGLLLGKSNYNDYVAGSLDDARIYDRALTPAEVVLDMNR